MDTRQKSSDRHFEWARRKISNMVTEINTTQIYLEKIHERMIKQLKVIRRFEEAITGAAIRYKRYNGNLEVYHHGDKEFIPLWISTLYAKVALDLENDLMELKQQTSSHHDDCNGGRIDLMEPLFEEIITIAMSYLNVVEMFRKKDQPPHTHISSRHEVREGSAHYLECLKALVETNINTYQDLIDGFFRNSINDLDPIDEDPLPPKIPAMFIDFINQRKGFFKNYLLPEEVLLFTMTEEHLSPSVLIIKGIETILDHVSSRAHTLRQSGKAHQLVLDHAERVQRSQINDPNLAKDLRQIMDYYSQKRVQIFYADCYYALLKKAVNYQKKFYLRCGCMEPFHVSIGKI